MMGYYTNDVIVVSKLDSTKDRAKNLRSHFNLIFLIFSSKAPSHLEEPFVY